MAETKRDNSIQVLAKVVAILDQLAADGEVTPARLADLIDEPRSTVYRLLNSLQQAGLIEPGVQRGAYRLGLKLFRLGSAVAARFDERQAALPVMERVHGETGETVFLCVRRGFEAVCIERLDGQRVQSLALRVGGSLPLHAGGAPRALLAYEPRAFWDEYLAHEDPRVFTPHTPATRDQLLRELQSVRALGYAVSDEDVTPGIAAIGVPVFDYTGKVRASISISGIRAAILGDGAGMVDQIVAAAHDISRALGFDARASSGGLGD